MEQHKILTWDNISLNAYYQSSIINDSNPPLIIWVHGAFEHALRYQDPIRWFAEQGYQSIVYDQRGHGKSGGRKMAIRSFLDYAKDLIDVYKYFESKSNADLFIVGHSMGGLVVVRFLQEFDNILPIKAVALSSPFMGLKAEVPAWKKALSGMVVKLAPDFSLPTGLDVSLLSRNSQVGVDYANDPLVSKTTTAIWFEETMNACRLAPYKASLINMPILIMQGEQDGIADNQASQKFFDKIKSPNKILKVWEGAYHELFNEINKDEIYQYLYQYLHKNRTT
jgi:lysophospholipase